MLQEWRLIHPDMRIGVRIVATTSSVAGATKIQGVAGDMPTASRFTRAVRSFTSRLLPMDGRRSWGRPLRDRSP